MTEHVDLVVVGAGPGGLEAAIVAQQSGATVVVIDTYPRPGGQYFKRLPRGFQSDHSTERDRDAEDLMHRLAGTAARVFADTVVWNIAPAADGEQWRVFLAGPAVPGELLATAIIVATGAYDRPIAFPGWTLPGVITAGAAQTLVKNQGVLPGQRILISGTGPLQLAVAAQLTWAGAKVVSVLEGAHVGLGSVRHAPAMWGQWARLREGLDYSRALRKADVPYRTGWSVIEARGEGEVREAVIARLDGDWRPITGSEQVVSIDTLVIGYGFLPATELTRLLGCEHDFVPERGGLVPRRDERMQTTLRGVYAVGDGTGIGGVELARIEGRIAGLAAAQRLGRLDEGTAKTGMAREQSGLRRERRFARLLGDMFTPGPGIYTMATNETRICRCEEVTLGEINQAIDAGCDSVIWVKRMTRAGMGSCQGRICGELVARAMDERIGEGHGRLRAASVRPPVRVVGLGTPAEGGDR